MIIEKINSASSGEEVYSILLKLKDDIVENRELFSTIDETIAIQYLAAYIKNKDIPINFYNKYEKAFQILNNMEQKIELKRENRLSESIDELFNNILYEKDAVEFDGILVYNDKALNIANAQLPDEATKTLGLESNVAIYEMYGCGTDVYKYVIHANSSSLTQDMYDKLKRDFSEYCTRSINNDAMEYKYKQAPSSPSF